MSSNLFVLLGVLNVTAMRRKICQYSDFPGPYSPTFGRNTEIYSAYLRI